MGAYLIKQSVVFKLGYNVRYFKNKKETVGLFLWQVIKLATINISFLTRGHAPLLVLVQGWRHVFNCRVNIIN
ncbi:MAG: hypothetical protein DRQ51_04310 [Gammaproteobacteria bacterium]|nr:MAG: hypothetical protein DRQ51_04310 [Gammaproteobacteria bacterium]